MFLVVIDVGSFRSLPEQLADIECLFSHVKSAATRPGAEIRIPGEASARLTSERLKTGIPVDATTIAELRQLAAELQIAFDPGQLAAD
jgi:LDH2 family malate/lactate/ureidoglycolate dehydrogenase